MSTDHQFGEIDATPAPSALMESLRSFGYSPASSIADLIDNSVSAGAKRIEVNMRWDGPDSWLTIADDGSGMSSWEVDQAMRPGSRNPLDSREEGDLGRFGLGLKTASFSQARILTVVTRKAGEDSAVRCWDLDHVQRVNRWVVLDGTDFQDDLFAVLPDASGTVVSWKNLDRIVDERTTADEDARSAFYKTVEEVREHLEMVFHRFLEGGLTITVNGVVCEAWDPFLSDHEATEQIGTEPALSLVAAGATHRIKVTPYVLPHRSKLDRHEHARSAGPRGWNLQQGFYLYRSDRLIVTGDWFDRGMKPEEHHKLARIAVEITHDLDELWDLDVRKAKARPPVSLQPDFRRIAQTTRKRAELVYRTRGNSSVGASRRSGPRVPVWEVAPSRTGVAYRLNRKHPIISEALHKGRPLQLIEDLVKLAETRLPLDHILSQGYSDEDKLTGSNETLDSATLEIGKRLFCQLVANGETPDEARAAVAVIQPFETAHAFLEALDEETCQ
jgi:hypothetical protein